PVHGSHESLSDAHSFGPSFRTPHTQLVGIGALALRLTPWAGLSTTNHRFDATLNAGQHGLSYRSAAYAAVQESQSSKEALMRASLFKTQPIRVAVIESDPLRFVGLRACLASESDFELSPTSLSEAGVQQNIDLVLLGTHIGSNLFEVVASLKAARPGLRIIV